MQLIVVGFHRSGTSLLTQLLHAGGLFVGDDLLGAMPSNPYGHYEDREVLELHRQIMDDHGVGWQIDRPRLFTLSPAQWVQMERFIAKRDAAHPLWGFKDPRVCFFLGPWKYLMPDAKFVVVYRDPSDSARSLELRQSRDYLNKSGNAEHHLRFFREPDHALRLWDTYNRAVTRFVRHHLDDCLVVPFSDLQSGQPILRQINDKFGCRLREVPTETVFDAQVTSRRSSPQWAHRRETVRRLSATWSELLQLQAMTTGVSA